MTLKETLLSENERSRCLRFETLNDEGVSVSHATVTFCDSRFAGSWVRTMLVGGVGTDVLYRRMGLVRGLFGHLFSRIEEFGAAVSLLHPFSFSYYRKFGYERVSDTVVARFPITALDFVPRYAGAECMKAEDLPAVLALFDACTAGRNVTLRRTDGGCFPCAPDGKRRTYLFRDERGDCCGYAVIEPEKHFDGINHMVSDDLHVYELLYTDAAALKKILGFLRMFEGELTTVKLHDIGMLPEVDEVLRHYMHTTYEIHPDIMARVLDTAALLRANAYPDDPGRFVLRVEDALPSVGGTFAVEYGKGQCCVARTDASADLTVPAPALARLLYGCAAYTPALASYMDGVSFNTPAADFFRAFPKRPGGVFNHF